MGKALESFGIIEGHDISQIGKLTANKDKMFEEISKIDKNIQKEVITLIEKDGIVFAITKKKIIKGLYLFEKNKLENETKVNHVKTLFTKDVSSDVIAKYDQLMKNIVTDNVSQKVYDKVTFNDEVFEKEKTTTTIEKVGSSLTGFLMGFAIGWLIFDDLLLGLAFGLIFAPTFTTVEVVVSKKRGRKKQTKKDGKN